MNSFTRLDDLWLPTNTRSRAITPENPTGEPGGGGRSIPDPDGCAGLLGVGWKARPCIGIAPGETATLCDIEGPGCLTHLWMTFAQPEAPGTLPWLRGVNRWRDLILRFYWEDTDVPAVECPAGDFFACGWGRYVPVVSETVCVNPGKAFNCYWRMPFLRRCRITLENRWKMPATLFYQFDYTLRELPAEVLYFHAQFRRSNPTAYKKPHLIVETQGRGQYAGTYMCWGSNNVGWWGEGEVKFYIDADKDFPTICTTGTEDYFCGAYNFENTAKARYETYCTPYAGLPQVIQPDGLYQSQTRFGMYRWHIADPICFKERLKVDVQALGWGGDGRFKPLQDDLATTAFWYQTLPSPTFPPLPPPAEMEVV